MGMFTQLGPLLIYFAGGWLIISKADPTLTVGTITASVALINRLYRPVESLLNIQVDFTRSLALFTRIFDYFDREIAITSPPDGKRYPMDKDCNIQFSHVSFSYLPEKPLLTDVNFYLPTGKTYAIVGPSGSGKSTLVNLIPRLYDVTGGYVFINGVDVRRYDLSYLRSNVGVVTQETYLFNGTIRDNLLYAKADATQEELEEACRIASIHDFILRQPDGYDTEVGNRGLKLSGGEKQRLSIARVILKNPRILILAPASSSRTGSRPSSRPTASLWSRTASSPSRARTTSFWPEAASTASCTRRSFGRCSTTRPGTTASSRTTRSRKRRTRLKTRSRPRRSPDRPDRRNAKSKNFLLTSPLPCGNISKLTTQQIISRGRAAGSSSGS